MFLFRGQKFGNFIGYKVYFRFLFFFADFFTKPFLTEGKFFRLQLFGTFLNSLFWIKNLRFSATDRFDPNWNKEPYFFPKRKLICQCNYLFICYLHFKRTRLDSSGGSSALGIKWLEKTNWAPKNWTTWVQKGPIKILEETGAQRLSLNWHKKAHSDGIICSLIWAQWKSSRP